MPTTLVAPQLVELLDRQFGFLLGLEGARRIIFLPRLLALLVRQPGIAEHIQDLKREVADALEAYRRANEKAVGGLLVIWKDYGAALQTALAGKEEEKHLSAYGVKLDACPDALRKPYSLEFPKHGPIRHKDLEGASRMIHAFIHWGKCASESEFRDMLERLGEIRRGHEYAYRTFRMASETLAGLALERLIALARRANPAPPGPKEPDVTFGEYVADDLFAYRLHGDQVSQGGDDKIDVANDRIEEDAHLLHEDLRMRVLEGASRAAIVRRYGARCEGFDAYRLRQGADANPRNAERFLTLDFATYLFDQGFNPIIDATIAGLRPDVVDPSLSSLFYVEAKQYDKEHPRSDIARGIRQVWVTWGRLRQRYSAPEAFVLVFRRSGPLIIAPPVVVHDGLRMHLIVVDITPAEDTGSNEAHKPISFSAAELLPDPGE